MSPLTRTCVSIAAIGFGLTVGCTDNTLGVCDTKKNEGNCTADNLKVLSSRICQNQDWALRVQFANIDLAAFNTISFTLEQTSSKASLPILLHKDSQAGVYKATVKQADLQPFRTGSATLSLDNEPGFSSQKININSLFSLKKVTQDYVDPGTVGMDGKPTYDSYPWPERVGVRPDGGLVVLNEGVDGASGSRAWKVLHLQYDAAKELSGTPILLFVDAVLAKSDSSFALDVNAKRLIAAYNFGADAAAVINCSGMEAGLDKCTKQSDIADTMFTSLMHRDYKAFAAHPRDPLIAYVDGSGTLFSSVLPDPATMTKVAWKSSVAPPAGQILGQVLPSMGKLNAADQLTPSLLAAYQDPAAMTLKLAAFWFNTSGDGSLVADAAMTTALSQSGLIGAKSVDALAIGDLDGDNLDEIVFVRGGRIQGLNNLGGGSFCPEDLGAAPSEVTAMAIGDINGDKRNDLVVISKLAKTVTAYLNNPNP